MQQAVGLGWKKVILILQKHGIFFPFISNVKPVWYTLLFVQSSVFWFYVMPHVKVTF